MLLTLDIKLMFQVAVVW